MSSLDSAEDVVVFKKKWKFGNKNSKDGGNSDD
jgi:hypothetical protein